MTFPRIPRQLPAFGILVLLLTPAVANAEFYSYEDKSGTIHFVDDKSKIPKEYRQKLEVRKDKYDDLPEEERAIMLQQDRKGYDAARRMESEEAERSRRTRSEREKREAMELQRRALITPVLISGRQVFVPVRLVNGSAETDAMLLLDTGATTSVITPEVAARLNIEQAENIRARVVGGRDLRVKRTVLKQMQVGPVKRRDQEVMIIRQGSGGSGDGLLGMNFLAGLKYTIDFEKQTINWIP
jgi:predicted aspartyl protease